MLVEKPFSESTLVTRIRAHRVRQCGPERPPGVVPSGEGRSRRPSSVSGSGSPSAAGEASAAAVLSRLLARMAVRRR
jgi:hypothetical protein